MILINKTILNIIDLNSNVVVKSNDYIDITNEEIYQFILKHVERCVKNSKKRNGKMDPLNPVAQLIQDRIVVENDLIEFSHQFTDLLFDQLSNSEEQGLVDVIFCDFNIHEVRHILVLELKNATAYTHQIHSVEGGTKNDISKYRAILPNTSSGISSFLIVNTNNFEVELVEKNRFIDGKDQLIYSKLILKCPTNISTDETIKVVHSAIHKIAEDYGQDPMIPITKAKTYLYENSEVSQSMKPKELAEEIFESKTMQSDFLTFTSAKGIHEEVRLEQDFVKKKAKTHKIMTDTGIELIIPTDYMMNEEYVEFVTDADGSIAIKLKNIGKILNK